MSDFMNAMDISANKYTFTEKGQVSFTQNGVGDDMLAFYFKLVRGATKDYVEEQMNLLSADPAKLENLMVLMFQTRDIRGGKGERELFYNMFLYLYKTTSRDLMLPIISLIPIYGSFKDLNVLWEKADTFEQRAYKSGSILKQDIIKLYTLHLKSDETLLGESYSEDPSFKFSLAAKWAPRESGHFCEMARELAREYFKSEIGTSKKIYTNYRKLVSKLNKKLDTTEIHMAGNTWKDIKPSKVSSRCLMINRDAFQNKIHAGANLGEQRSLMEDRVTCAQNFKDHLESGGKVHGAANYPSEIVKRYNGGKGDVKDFDPILEAQWQDIRSEYEQTFIDKLATGKSCRNTIPIIDVSGSMTCGNPSPIDAAVGLGILLTELSSGPFRNRAITFSKTPEWIDLTNANSLLQKINITTNAGWGMTTNLYSVFSLILKVAIEHRLSDTELGNMDLIILSDMQFDASQKNSDAWNTTLKNIKKMYKTLGYETIPHIIFWNLCGTTMDFPEKADTPNVTMVSGFSPSAAKTLLVEGADAVKKEKKTPLDTLHEILTDERYDTIRNVYRTYIRSQVVNHTRRY